MNSNIETKNNQIENDDRTNKLNEDAKRRLQEEIEKKNSSVTQTQEHNNRLNSSNNTLKIKKRKSK